MTLRRVVRTEQVTLSHVFDPAEIPTAAGGTVAVALTRWDGTSVASGNATGPDENQAYTFTYAGSATLDELTVTWSATVAGDAVTLDSDRLDIVGSRMFGLAEAREFDPATLANVNRFPTTTLESTRIEVEDEALRICRQSFIPRFAHEVLDGTGDARLALTYPLTRKVRSISVANFYGDTPVAFSSDQLSRVAIGPDGVLRLDSGFFFPSTALWWGAFWPLGRSNITVEYEHGMDNPPPPVRRAGKIRLKSMLLEPSAALPDSSELQGTGAVLTSPDECSTGIPAVDAAYARVPSQRPGFG